VLALEDTGEAIGPALRLRVDTITTSPSANSHATLSQEEMRTLRHSHRCGPATETRAGRSRAGRGAFDHLAALRAHQQHVGVRGEFGEHRMSLRETSIPRRWSAWVTCVFRFLLVQIWPCPGSAWTPLWLGKAEPATPLADAAALDEDGVAVRGTVGARAEGIQAGGVAVQPCCAAV
jgi:hypothetical protein